MERELWKIIVASLRRLPRRCPANGLFTNQQILAVYLWAALHDRPVSWACKRVSWPFQAWRRVLPNQSTMSRRTRTESFCFDLGVLLADVQRRLPEGRLMFADGKAFEISGCTNDRDAQSGWGCGHFARGYRLHVVTDESGRVIGWRIMPLGIAETDAVREIIKEMPKPRKAKTLIADAGYDSNNVYRELALRGLRLIAPRKRPGTRTERCRNHPHRLQAINLTEQRGGWMWDLLRTKRWTVERFFAGLVTSGVGANGLPTWVRRLHRVRAWIGAKLVINAARIVRAREGYA